MINAIYDLPFGQGKTYLSDASGVTGKLVSGWALTSIVTLESGFPFTPQLSYNPSNNGDARKSSCGHYLNPISLVPHLGKPAQWFNPAAFIAPPTTIGFYGNMGRDEYAPDLGLPLGIFRC